MLLRKSIFGFLNGIKPKTHQNQKGEIVRKEKESKPMIISFKLIKLDERKDIFTIKQEKGVSLKKTLQIAHYLLSDECIIIKMIVVRLRGKGRFHINITRETNVDKEIAQFYAGKHPVSRLISKSQK